MRRMDDRLIARLVAAGRVLFGIVCLVAPRQILRQWGKDVSAPVLWWIRDRLDITHSIELEVRIRALAALNRPDPDVSWVVAGAIADTADAAVAIAFRDELGSAFTATTLAVAGPAAALGWKAAAGLKGS